MGLGGADFHLVRIYFRGGRYISEYTNKQGHFQVVRNGYLPGREIQTGIGPVKVKVPKIRDKSGQGIKFNSALLPPYLRKTRSVEGVLLWQYLKCISTGGFQVALQALLGSEAKGLSASTISRLKRVWEEEHEAWSRRNLENKRYVYIWADGVYFNIRSDDARQCILLLFLESQNMVEKNLLPLRMGIENLNKPGRNCCYA